jgi:hypothetical protein
LAQAPYFGPHLPETVEIGTLEVVEDFLEEVLVVFLVEVFLVVVFLVEDFLVEDFLVVVFLVEDFLVLDFTASQAPNSL